eukprot:311105-Rhodomonas_salina.1
MEQDSSPQTPQRYARVEGRVQVSCQRGGGGRRGGGGEGGKGGREGRGEGGGRKGREEDREER